ncbi:MAG: hypothetical protein QXU18_04635 [Thermoplasmatales archaeon]
MKSRFLSYGAGMQTFALLVMAEHGDLKIDEVVFADTGAEHPETYEHINTIAKPICNRIGIPFTTISMSKTVDDISGLSAGQLAEYKRMLNNSMEFDSRTKRMEIHSNYHTENGIPKKVVHNLRDEIIARRRVPSINPQSRWCTSDAKIIPIYKGYIRPAQEKGEYVKPCKAVIGLGYEELTRMYSPHLSEYTVEYPLIDRKMKRSDCVKYVQDAGYKPPPKSGCYFCPFQPNASWGQLLRTHPDLYWDSVKLEEADLNFPKYGLNPKGITLRKLSERYPDNVQLTLDLDKADMQCEQAGYCGV